MSKEKIKLLYITHKWLENDFGGRQNLTRININCIYSNEEIDEKYFLYLEINKKQGILRKIANYLKLYVDGVSNEKLTEIKKIINKNKINTIFIDGSSIGIINKIIKNEVNKNIKIITFFHHKEKKLFYEFARESKTLKSLLLYIAVSINEKFSEVYSDHYICLTKRDSEGLRNNVSIFPIVVNSNYFIEKNNIAKAEIYENNHIFPEYLLFVGGGGLIGNKKGVIWFIENVLNYLNIKLIVVGTGYEDIKNKYNNVNFLGKVLNLTGLYTNSLAIIAPIFLGSGMKTKVAEAASYGKVTIGTREAFEGYDNHEKIGILCNLAADFIKVINKEEYKKFDPEKIKNIYSENYSIEAQRGRFKKFFLSISN